MTQLTPPRPLHRDTLAVREAVARSQYGENSEALYLTSGYVQPSAEAAARRFAGDEDGYTYGRYGNPTVSSFEQRLAALEGTEAAIGTASGMSAILMMCLALLKAGDHIVCSRSMFGSTIRLIGTDLARFGVESTFVSQTDTAAWQAAGDWPAPGSKHGSRPDGLAATAPGPAPGQIGRACAGPAFPGP